MKTLCSDHFPSSEEFDVESLVRGNFYFMTQETEYGLATSYEEIRDIIDDGEEGVWTIDYYFDGIFQRSMTSVNYTTFPEPDVPMIKRGQSVYVPAMDMIYIYDYCRDNNCSEFDELINYYSSDPVMCAIVEKLEELELLVNDSPRPMTPC